VHLALPQVGPFRNALFLGCYPRHSNLKISTWREFVFPDSSISFGDYYANIDDKDDTFGTETWLSSSISYSCHKALKEVFLVYLERHQ
jgi:hypothetical protein